MLTIVKIQKHFVFKAKPEEVTMIKELLENFIDENMDIIAREVEEVEEEEEPIPEVTISWIRFQHV